MDPITLLVIPVALIAGLGLMLAAFVPKEQPTTPPDSPPRFGPMSQLRLGTFMATVEKFFHQYPPMATVDAEYMTVAFRNFISDEFMLENFGEDGLH